MEDARRWSVTYTKHIKQKRKVYQDGFLELQSSRHKVTLYDESDKLLESKFVKKDDVVDSGETLTFDSYLVDIGEPCGVHKPTSTLNSQKYDRKVAAISESLHNFDSRERKPVFGMRKGRGINLSPSQRMIREFRKREMNRVGSSPSCMDIRNTSPAEWQVLYTTQITQKAKKFHDGFLQLVVCGLQRRQVMLYDITRRHLESKFLKKDEVVCSGESLAFDGHLVDIGEQIGIQKPEQKGNQKFEQQGNQKLATYSTLPGKTDINNSPDKVLYKKIFSAEKISLGKVINPNSSSPRVETKLSLGTPSNEPTRTVYDILSILKKPVLGKVETMNKTSMKEHLESDSSSVHFDAKCLKEYTEEFSEGGQDELAGNKSDLDCRIKVLEPANVKLLVATEIGGELQDKSGPANYKMPILSEECSSHNKLASTSAVEPRIIITALLDSDCQKPIESETLTSSNEKSEPEKLPKDIMTESNVAEVNGLISTELPKVSEDKDGSSFRCIEAASDLHTNEFPSFDLGF